MKEKQIKKTVNVRHHKSFANTHIGNALDKGAATAVTAAIGVGVTVAAKYVVEQYEAYRLNRDVNKLFSDAKKRYSKSENK